MSYKLFGSPKVKTLFWAYEMMVSRNIASCKTPEQLQVAHNMMNIFQQHFSKVISPGEYIKAVTKIEHAYRTKDTQLFIL